MKKLSCLLAIVVISFFVGVEVNAETPIKSVNFCGIVTTNDVTNSVRLVKSNNTCKVDVELSDPSYIVVSGAGEVQFKDGQNVHNIVVKDVNGTETTYSINVSFNSGYNSSNPQTGDVSVVYYVAGALCLVLIAISYNRIKKYSKDVA